MIPDRRSQRTENHMELEICQLIIPGLVGLIVIQGQGHVFMQETLKYPHVYKVIINLNLNEAVSPHLAPELHSLKNKMLLVCPLLQLGLLLASDGLGLGHDTSWQHSQWSSGLWVWLPSFLILVLTLCTCELG